MGIGIVLGAMEIVVGVLLIVRRSHYASLLAPDRVARTRRLLLAFAVLALLFGTLQVAEELI